MSKAKRLGRRKHFRAHVEKGIDLFNKGRFGEALPVLRAAIREAHSGEAYFYLGATLERLGELAEADEALMRAADFDTQYTPPLRLEDGEFDAAVESAIDELPGEVREILDRYCQVVREDYPEDGRVAREGVDPLLLGECLGTADMTRNAEDGPVQIAIYRRNLEKFFPTREELIEEITITLFHEIGHALGLEEDDVEELGLG